MNTNKLNARSSLARRQRRGQAPRVECLESRELLTYPAAGVTFLVNKALFDHKNTAFQVINGVDSRLNTDLTSGPLATLNSAPITTTTATTFLNSVSAVVQTYQTGATAQLSPRFPFVWGQIVGNTTRIQNGITAQNALFQVGAIDATTFSQNVTAIINGRTVPAAPTITSAGNTTFTVGTAGTFTVTAAGVPTLTLSETGALPGGMTFVDNHNGTATLAGTPAAGSAGTFPLTITAHNGVGSDATQSFTLTVSPAALVSIAVAPVNPSVAKGLTEQFTATGTYTDGSTADLTTQVTWVSGTTSVATISNTAGSQGLASTLATGTTAITAALGGITSPSDTLTVTALKSIAVAPVNPSVAKGLTEQFTATGTYTDGSTADLTTQVTWASGTTSVATISNAAGSQGLASTLATGTTAITAALGGITSPSDTLTVTTAALKSIAVAPVNPSVAKGLTEQFTATGTYTDGSTADLTTQVTWVSGTTSVATISNTAGSQGLASTLATGTTAITAALGGITSPSDTLTVTAAALKSIAVAPVESVGGQGAHRIVHGHGDLHRRLDRRPHHPGDLGVGDDLGRDDLQRRRQPGTGLHAGHGHDRDHRRPRRNHEPKRHPNRRLMRSWP